MEYSHCCTSEIKDCKSTENYIKTKNYKKFYTSTILSREDEQIKAKFGIECILHFTIFKVLH